MLRTIALCSLIIAATAALWFWLSRRESAAVIVYAPTLSAPPRIVPADVKASELRSIEESEPPTPGIAWKENAPQTLLLSPGERRAITVSVAGNVKLQLHSQVPVSFAFGTVQGEMFADFDRAVRAGSCFADAVTESTSECNVTPGASLLIEDARPLQDMAIPAALALGKRNIPAIIATTKPSEIVFSLSTR